MAEAFYHDLFDHTVFIFGYIRLTCFKTAIHVPETRLEGRVSRNFDIGLSLNFIACRSGGFKKNTKKSQKLPVFFSEMKTRT